MATMPGPAPDVFISYAHEDALPARRIQNDLEQHGLHVWRDDTIKGGENIILRVQEGIASARFFVPLMSEHYDRSLFAKEELSAVLMEVLSPAQRGIVPIRLDDHPVPPLLRARKYCDFRGSYLAGLTELADALGLSWDGPGLSVASEDVVLSFSDDGTVARWKVDRRFELSSATARMLEINVYADSAPTRVEVGNGRPTVDHEPGFYAIHSEHDPALPALTPLRQRISWHLEGSHGDREDFWFYRLPTTFGECCVTVRFPLTRLPSRVVTEFERDGIREQGPKPVISKAPDGEEYSCKLNPADSRFRSLHFTWTW